MAKYDFVAGDAVTATARKPKPAAAPRKKMPQQRLTPYEAALKVGLIGCIDGPPDLAENRRKYIRQALCVKYRSH
jgi:hypothetical protein